MKKQDKRTAYVILLFAFACIFMCITLLTVCFMYLTNSFIEIQNNVENLIVKETSENFTNISVEEKEYDENMNYLEKIEIALMEPFNHSFSQIKEYERLRNLKIDDLDLDESKTNYFSEFSSWNELFESGHMDEYFLNINQKYRVNVDRLNLRLGPSTKYNIDCTLQKNNLLVYLGTIIDKEEGIWYRVSRNNKIGYVYSEYLSWCDPSVANEYTEEDVYWLAVGITEEAGCKWFPEYIRNYVGCVILNRMESKQYPNTIYDVLYDEGQYAFACNEIKYGIPHQEPFEWSIKTAIDLLEGNRMLPTNIIFQANFPQGNYTYHEYYDSKLDSTLYFCSL